jgi:hypothetical protein
MKSLTELEIDLAFMKGAQVGYDTERISLGLGVVKV